MSRGLYQLFTLATNVDGISLAGGKAGNASAAIASTVSAMDAVDMRDSAARRRSLEAMVRERYGQCLKGGDGGG